MADCLQVFCRKGKFVVKQPKELSGYNIDYKIVGRKRQWFLVEPLSDKQKEIALRYGILLGRE